MYLKIINDKGGFVTPRDAIFDWKVTEAILALVERSAVIKIAPPKYAELLSKARLLKSNPLCNNSIPPTTHQE